MGRYALMGFKQPYKQLSYNRDLFLCYIHARRTRVAATEKNNVNCNNYFLHFHILSLQIHVAGSPLYENANI